MKNLIIPLFLLFTFLSFSQEKYPKNYFRNPLDIPIFLSGSFGELRSNHFHAGIDIKTQGKEGLNVFAVADGYVSRIKVQQYGYGKAIYITHPNGFTSVYGHLSKFNDEIEEYVRGIQYKKENYQTGIEHRLMNVAIHRIIKLSKDQRVFFCGDVHGNYSQLQKQLSEVSFCSGVDILVLTGDIIDRGKENEEMIEFVTCTPGVYSVLGNHESMFLNAVHDESVRSVYTEPRMGGSWIESFSQKELEDMATLIESCMSVAITIELNEYRIGVIHASAPTNWDDVVSLNPEDVEFHLWNRGQFEEARRDIQKKGITGIDAVVHGHVCSDLTVSGNQVWIDTNRSTGKLTILESKEVIDLALAGPC